MISRPLIVELKGILEDQGINLGIAEVTEVANALLSFTETLIRIEQQTKMKMNKKIKQNDNEKQQATKTS
jgi:enoyl-[acyl-carrier-protein] reductase (NADH)